MDVSNLTKKHRMWRCNGVESMHKIFDISCKIIIILINFFFFIADLAQFVIFNALHMYSGKQCCARISSTHK